MNNEVDRSASPGAWERHSRSVGFGLFVLALGVLAGAGARDASSRDDHASWRQGPKRQLVELTQAQRDAQIQEMQRMLRGMQQVMDGAQAMDVPKIRAAAEAVGMTAATRDEDLLAKLPKDYRARLMDNHAAFDAMADAIRGFTARDSVLAHLAKISGQCVSCHAAYTFGPAK
jgi:cytochrome c556